MTEQETEIKRVISYIRSCRDAGIDTTITIDKSRNHFILNALEEIQQYRALEERLKRVYGDCQGLLERVVMHLEAHASADLSKPVFKARLLTDEDAICCNIGGSGSWCCENAGWKSHRLE